MLNQLSTRSKKKLKDVKQYFNGWGFHIQGEKRKRKKDLQDSLAELEAQEELATLSFSQMMEKSNLLCELMGILEEEELYWFKRSHETWLHKGDNNTDYFHRIANGRKRKIPFFFSRK